MVAGDAGQSAEISGRTGGAESALEAARRLDAGPRVVVTDIEAQIGSRYTYDTLAWLTRRAPGVRFVWIMGADNLRQFHLWRHWRAIADLMPIVVVDRPGSTLRAMSSPAARCARALARRPSATRARLRDQTPPALVFLHGPRSGLSSTALRDERSSPGLAPQAARQASVSTEA